MSLGMVCLCLQNINQMMPLMHRKRHEEIYEALSFFDAKFLIKNQILFGGETRVALELNEYRESIDIDFLCPNKASFRAVRQQARSTSLGQLVLKEFDYIREIRADRDAVRCFIKIKDINIKLEFVSFADYDLRPYKSIFTVPCLDQHSCFLTKILANADRYADSPFKDIFDLLAMFDAWGEIPQSAWNEADLHYGRKVILYGMQQALLRIEKKPNDFLFIATGELMIDEKYAQQLLTTTKNRFKAYLSNQV